MSSFIQEITEGKIDFEGQHLVDLISKSVLSGAADVGFVVGFALQDPRITFRIMALATLTGAPSFVVHVQQTPSEMVAVCGYQGEAGVIDSGHQPAESGRINTTVIIVVAIQSPLMTTGESAHTQLQH